MYPKSLKNIKISLGPEACVSQNLEKNQKFAWTRSLCGLRPRKMIKFRLDPKLMYPKTLKNINISLGPKAYVSLKLDKYQIYGLPPLPPTSDLFLYSNVHVGMYRHIVI